jgi:hypothetical protein
MPRKYLTVFCAPVLQLQLLLIKCSFRSHLESHKMFFVKKMIKTAFFHAKYYLSAFSAAPQTGLSGGSAAPHGLRPCAATDGHLVAPPLQKQIRNAFRRDLRPLARFAVSATGGHGLHPSPPRGEHDPNDRHICHRF